MARVLSAEVGMADSNLISLPYFMIGRVEAFHSCVLDCCLDNSDAALARVRGTRSRDYIPRHGQPNSTLRKLLTI